MRSIVELVRPSHWTKNLFLLIPVFFAGNIFQTDRISITLLGILSFSLIASSIYIFNDLMDLQSDIIHPIKRHRPLASGVVSKSTAILFLIGLMITGVTIAWLLNFTFFVLICIYIALNIGYSLGLKHVAILDLFIVALGFLIRIYSGGILSNVEVTNWLSIMILLLSLFLVLAKRRDDLILQSESNLIIRKSSSAYNLEFINACLTIFAAVIVVAYIMYTVSDDAIKHFDTKYLYTTTLFVIAGIMRYLQITIVEHNSGSPTKVLINDKFTLITIICWILSFYLIIYS